MSTVFVVQEQQKFDISPALEFGEIKVILPPLDTTFSYDFTVARMHEVLEKITPDDYLLLTGDPISIGLATTIANYYLGEYRKAGLRTPGPLKLLKWMRREFKYLPIVVETGV